MAVALFETLDAYLKEQRLRCREVFNHFDGGAKGWLAPEELGRLVEHFLPGQVGCGAGRGRAGVVGLSCGAGRCGATACARGPAHTCAGIDP